MTSSFLKCSAQTDSIESSNTDTGRENILHFYCDIAPKTLRMTREFIMAFCAGILADGNECFQPQTNPEISPSREWVAKISDFFEHVFVVPKLYFGPTGASRRPRIWYLAA